MNLLGLIALGMFLVCCVLLWLYFKLHRAEQKVQALQTQNEQQKAKIAAKEMEVKHAGISRHNHEAVALSSAGGVDEQLHTHNWFRDNGGRLGLSGVSQNLPKPSRHTGDEAADTGSQSDSSGDL